VRRFYQVEASQILVHSSGFAIIDATTVYSIFDVELIVIGITKIWGQPYA
jgi:hypothetical protein